MNTNLEKRRRIKRRVKADEALANTIDASGYELIGNKYLTEIEVKRAALHPSASLSDEVVRKVRAAAIGISLYDYEQTLLDMGMDY